MGAATEVEVPAQFAQALRELGLAGKDAIFGTPLTGGVSSDIWLIQTARGPVCAKRALAKLRVAADWRAPIERNRYEARWMRVACAAHEGCAPRVLGQHPALGVLVMDYLPPADFALWKQRLRDGQADVSTAQEVGRVLGAIHAYSARHPELAAEFDTDTIFFDIRLEPYLLATARKHPDLAARLEQLVDVTRSQRRALVHGDVSPKNILIGANGPVFLDAECAWWGDPAFDIAFCLNHLLLKCLWTPAATPAFLASFDAMADAYLSAVEWEPSGALEQRAAALLPGLFLARVDGKSPVEYITDEGQREQVRLVARELLAHPVGSLRSVRARWAEELGQ
ncbi:MAG TPA: aminoglycoside phosphotransferase family protein [Steroidobacteraceae bacterium]|nr:aminoglycoside phosphotransferase family protein [Steroidobacteraceae bacterium]